MRGATWNVLRIAIEYIDFNPRSSCEERLNLTSMIAAVMRNFNPRSSCEERRELDRMHVGMLVRFQSTLLMRGATQQERVEAESKEISIHAPHARSDNSIQQLQGWLRIFQSTLLMRGATDTVKENRTGITFQSTLLMRGATTLGARVYKDANDFNPRSSCEERPPVRRSSTMPSQFQSTLLMRGATIFSLCVISGRSISIHAPHARRDSRRVPVSSRPAAYFNPRSSCEERQ